MWHGYASRSVTLNLISEHVTRTLLGIGDKYKWVTRITYTGLDVLLEHGMKWWAMLHFLVESQAIVKFDPGSNYSSFLI